MPGSQLILQENLILVVAENMFSATQWSYKNIKKIIPVTKQMQNFHVPATGILFNSYERHIFWRVWIKYIYLMSSFTE